jgi:PIN domain nuclease of toxin-antitoxin system
LPEIVVLDSSAVLAVLYGEPGSDFVLKALPGALLSTVNLAEAHTKLVKDGAPSQRAWSRLIGLNCTVCGFEDAQARLTGDLVAKTRAHGLSLGDRACLALAIERNAKAYTADRVWKNVNLGIQVEVIR